MSDLLESSSKMGSDGRLQKSFLGSFRKLSNYKKRAVRHILLKATPFPSSMGVLGAKIAHLAKPAKWVEMADLADSASKMCPDGRLQKSFSWSFRNLSNYWKRVISLVLLKAMSFPSSMCVLEAKITHLVKPAKWVEMTDLAESTSKMGPDGRLQKSFLWSFRKLSNYW